MARVLPVSDRPPIKRPGGAAGHRRRRLEILIITVESTDVRSELAIEEAGFDADFVGLDRFRGDGSYGSRVGGESRIVPAGLEAA